METEAHIKLLNNFHSWECSTNFVARQLCFVAKKNYKKKKRTFRLPTDLFSFLIVECFAGQNVAVCSACVWASPFCNCKFGCVLLATFVCQLVVLGGRGGVLHCKRISQGKTASTVVLTVQAKLLRKLNALVVAVAFFEVTAKPLGQMRLKFQTNLVDCLRIFVGGNSQRCCKVVEVVLRSVGKRVGNSQVVANVATLASFLLVFHANSPAEKSAVLLLLNNKS